MFEIGETVLYVYPEGDADKATIVGLFASLAFIQLPSGRVIVTLLEDIVSLKERI